MSIFHSEHLTCSVFDVSSCWHIELLAFGSFAILGFGGLSVLDSSAVPWWVLGPSFSPFGVIYLIPFHGNRDLFAPYFKLWGLPSVSGLGNYLHVKILRQCGIWFD